MIIKKLFCIVTFMFSAIAPLQAGCRYALAGSRITQIICTIASCWVHPSCFDGIDTRALHYNDKPVTINYEHIFSIETKRRVKPSGRITKPQLFGFHHDPNNKQQEEGTVQYQDVIQGPCGSFKAKTIIIKGVYYHSKDKTFFPPQWNERKVLKKIIKVFADPSHTVSIDKGGCHKIERQTKTGLMIRIIFDPKQSKITTAYPIIS